MPEPVDLHGRINSHGAQPIGSPLPAYRNQAKQAWQVADFQRKRAEKAETALRRVQGQVGWAMLLASIFVGSVVWAIALTVLR